MYQVYICSTYTHIIYIYIYVHYHHFSDSQPVSDSLVKSGSKWPSVYVISAALGHLVALSCASSMLPASVRPVNGEHLQAQAATPPQAARAFSWQTPERGGFHLLTRCKFVDCRIAPGAYLDP